MVLRLGDWSRTWQGFSQAAPLARRTSRRRRLDLFTSGVAYVQRLEDRALLSGAVALNPSQTVTFQNGVNGYNGTTDASIRGNQQNTNTGNAVTLQGHGNPDRATLIRWDISGIPTGVAVTSASISFTISNASSQTYDLYAVLKPWAEGQVNWRRASTGVNWGTAGAQGSGDRGSTVLGTLTATATGTATITLNSAGIAQVQAWVNNPSSNFGFILQNYSATDNVDLRSSETATASQRPKLSISYTTDVTTVSFQNGIDGYNGTIDTRIAGDFRTQNDGNGAVIQTHGQPDRGTLIKWDISSIDSDAVVQSASITFNVTNLSPQSYELYALLRPWIETQATWNLASTGNSWGTPGAQGAGDRGSTVLGTLTAPANGLVTVQLNSAGIAQVQQWINNPSSNNGFVIADYANTDSLEMNSSEAANVTARPKLTITLANDRRSKLEEVTRGLMQYEAIFGEFTVDDVPAFFVTANSPYLSWRVHILPFIGYGDLYQQFHLDEAWDSAHNLTLLNQMPDLFRSRGLAAGTNLTGFRMFQGNGAFEYGKTNGDNEDGGEHTLLIFETMSQNADFWTKPDDIPFNPADPLANLTKPSDSFLVATVKGELKEINPNVAPATFAAFATWNGGEVLSAAQYANLYVNWDAADNADVSKAKLRDISNAFDIYVDVYGNAPPGDHVPAEWFDLSTGKPYLSWRVHLLPYMGYEDLYAQFHFNEAWNSAHNIQLLDKMPEEFRSRGLASGGTNSAFKIVTGSAAYNVVYVPGGTDSEGPAWNAQKDGRATTIQVIELTSEKAVPWTQWNEIEYSAANPLTGIGPVPADGLRVATWEEGIYTINPAATASNLGLFLTWDGNEIFGPAESSNVFLDWAQPDTVEARKTKLNQVGRAMENFSQQYFNWPPYGPGTNWNTTTHLPNLSWRVHILPHLGYTNLYNQFHLNEAWDSPHNLTLLDKMPEVFRTRGLAADTHMTGLQLFVGPGAYEYKTSSPDPNQWRGPRITDIRDGTEFTILAIELLAERAVEWTRPDGDIDFNPDDALAGVGSIPADGLLVTTFDSTVRTINPDVTAENLKTFVTLEGSEIYGAAETSNAFLDWQQPFFRTGPSIQGAEYDYSESKLRYIMYGLSEYDFTYGNMPVLDFPEFWDLAASTPEKPVPHLSWRVHLLPFVGYGSLYNEFHLDEAWDSPHNIQLLDKMPELYRSRDLPEDSNKTGFQLVVGDGAYEYTPSNGAYEGPNLRNAARQDGWFNTIGIMETLPEDAVEWTRPDGDIAFNPADPLGSLTLPADYILVAMLNGDARAFNPNLSAETFAAYLTWNGQEPVPYPYPDE